VATVSGVFFPTVNRPGREVSHPHSSCAEVKNEWCATSIPPMFLHGVDREYFTFTFTILEVICRC
jgi:hypothetical protein